MRRRVLRGAGHEPPSGAESLIVGDLHFAFVPSARRKTMQITVERNGELGLAAPPDVSRDALRRFVEEKRYWIYTKLAEKERLRKRVSAKEYVDGEGFLYLGRSYRLKLVEGQPEPLRLVRGRFQLRRDKRALGREHFVRWYSQRAREWLEARLPRFAARVGVTPGGLRIQDLGYRWGSCGKGARLYFHWKTILLPPAIVEYVLVHEMVHLLEPHHTPEFWRRLEAAMPDFEKRKVWLAEHGMDVEGI